MADLYELLLTLDLRADITDDEVAELRWQVGQGPRPQRLPIGADAYVDTYPLDDPADPDCRWEVATPEPAFAQRGPARRTGGALVAELVAREQADGWALTVRQELHPDDFYQLRTLLNWLGPRFVGAQTNGVEFFVGHLRFHESAEPTPLILCNGQIRLPSDIKVHTPDWQGG